MPYVIIIQNSDLASLLTMQGVIHAILGEYQSHGVGLILECSTIARGYTYMHHDDKGHSTLKYYAVIKEFKVIRDLKHPYQYNVV